MGNKVKDINIKILAYQLFNDIIDIEILIQIILKDMKSHIKLSSLLYQIRDDQRTCKNVQCKSLIPYLQIF